MAEIWPAALPQHLLVDGYTQGLGDGRLRSRNDAGPAKVRRRSSAMPGPLQGRMDMSGAQLADMRAFVESTLIGGTLVFTFPDPVTGGALLVRFATNLPSWTSRGPDIWTVSLDLEVLP